MIELPTPPTVPEGRLKRASRVAGFAYDTWHILPLPTFAVLCLVGAVRLLAAREWGDALLTVGLATLCGGSSVWLLRKRVRADGFLRRPDDVPPAA